MSEFLDKVESLRKTPASVAHRVALYLADRSRRAVLTEADDDVFVYKVLHRRLSNRRRDIGWFAALGRDEVLRAYAVLVNLGKSAQTFAIIDRDFNFDAPCISDDGHLYVTDGYSIENYLADREIVKELGQTIFGVEAGSDELICWENGVKKFFDEMRTTMRDEHVIALYCRKNSKICNLRNFSPTRHILIGADGKIAAGDNLEELFVRHTSADCMAITSSDRTKLEAILRSDDWRSWFRGHYFIELLVNFMNKFRVFIDQERKMFGRVRTHSRSELTVRHALEAGAAFIVPPKALNTFLENVST